MKKIKIAFGTGLVCGSVLTVLSLQVLRMLWFIAPSAFLIVLIIVAIRSFK